MKTQTSIADRLASGTSRWGGHQVIKNLTPANMTRWLEEYRMGRPFRIVEAWDEIEERDDVIPGVVSKRRMNVSSCDYEIVQLEETPEAERHAEALRECYDNITATDAVDRDIVGGMDLLVRQVMGAVGQKKAVHEIVWQPGSVLTAEMIRVSLRHFENTTGRLRFAPNGSTTEGTALVPGEWMVSATDLPPLMKATGIAYLYKTMPLRDWLTYSESNGLLCMLFKTRAAPGSDEWQKCEEAVAAIAGILGLVVSEGTEAERMGAGSGELPYPELIERMDRRISALWMGADLSTISADKKGASVQGAQERLLLEHDCKFVSNQINIGLGRELIKLRFGAKVRPLAYLRINPPMDIDEEKEQGKFTKAIDDGIEVSERQYRETLGLREPVDANDVLKKHRTDPTNPIHPTDPETGEDDPTAANEAPVNQLASAMAEDLAAFHALVESHLDEATFDPDALLRDLERELPNIFAAMVASGRTEEALRDTLASEIVQGVLSAQRGSA